MLHLEKERGQLPCLLQVLRGKGGGGGHLSLIQANTRDGVVGCNLLSHFHALGASLPSQHFSLIELLSFQMTLRHVDIKLANTQVEETARVVA